MDFVHLHAHSELSPDGLGTTEALVERAAKNGMSHLALTDHGSLGNAVNFWSTCKDHGIVPILGLEAYTYYAGQRGHVTMLSTDEKGFSNLIAISNKSHQNWVSGFPLMSFDVLSGMDTTGIQVLTGCPASPIHDNSLADAVNWAGAMYDIFHGNLWAELMCVVDEDFTSRPLEVAKALSLPIVLTNDVHYPSADQRGAHQILTQCRKGFSYDSDRLWLKTANEMEQTARRFFNPDDVKKWMLNTTLFADIVEPWDMSSPPTLPNDLVNELLPDFFDRLKAALAVDLGKNPSTAKIRIERYEKEFEVISNAGLFGYFVILDDTIRFANNNGIVVGPGRGSGAGCYLLYLLGVTGIDPIEHGLIFERFFNESRKEYPDVDIDIESNFRPQILEYMGEKWNGLQIATYSHYGHKVAVNDINRVLRLDFLTAKNAAENGPESDDFARWCTMHPDAKPSYDAMVGQIRHAGKHAGGIVITTRDVPIEMIGGQPVVAWTEGHERQLSKVGVVKYDILGLTALSQIHMMRDLVGVHGEQFPEDDDPVFKLFRTGDVLGIFQWTGSDGIREMTKKIAPRSFHDLTVINALYRPGALDAGTAEMYPQFAGSARKLEPRIDLILAETRGIICFQEQMMAVFAEVMGISFGESDSIRRLIVKPRPEDPKWVDAVDQTRNNFIASGLSRGFTRTLLNQLWSEIYTHTRYSFVRAHSASYVAIACEMAWFKLYHPVVFYAVAMECDPGNIQAYMIEAITKGITLVKPHVNRPLSQFVADPDNNQIFIPLSIVKFFGTEGAKSVADEFDKNGPFLNTKDFRKRLTKGTVNARASRQLWLAGAFVGVDGSSDELFPDKGDLPIGSIAETEALGFALPSKKMAAYINSFVNDEWVVVGFVKDWKDKNNKRGKKYRVYKLSPSGSFWIDDQAGMDKLQKGDFVRVRKNRYGKAVDRFRVKDIE